MDNESPALTFHAVYDDETKDWCGSFELSTPGLPPVKRHMYCSDTPERAIVKCMGYAEEMIKRYGSIDAFVRHFWKGEHSQEAADAAE